jgi:alpha,alpha-trehalase
MLIIARLRFFSVDYNGVVPEKFDVVKLSHLVDAEYGNQGLDFKLLNREGPTVSGGAGGAGYRYIPADLAGFTLQRRSKSACTF